MIEIIMSRRKSFFFCMLFVTCIGWGLPVLSHAATTDRLPGPGNILDSVSVLAPDNEADGKYLGVQPGIRFQPAELKARLVLIEVMNVYCASCQFMKPYMNELFTKVQADAGLKDQVKMMAIGAGNDHWDVAAEEAGYDFPLLSDADYNFHRTVGQPPTPFLIFARPYSQNRLLVVDSFLGRLPDVDALLAMVRKALDTPLSKLTIRPFQSPGIEAKDGSGLVIPLSESQLNDKIRQSLTIGGVQAQGIEQITLPHWGRLFTGILPDTNRRIFARVVARKIPCGDCHDVFYIYSFDDTGHFLNFIPISVFKYGNRPWDDKDIAKIRDRFQGKSLLSGFTYNAKVDAVSSATISTRLIFDSLGNTPKLMDDLTKSGHLR